MRVTKCVSANYPGAFRVRRRRRRGLRRLSCTAARFLPDDPAGRNPSRPPILPARVRGPRRSRSADRNCAIAAGLEHAQGEWVVVMDCDLQDRPEEIERLYTKACEGHDVVFAERETRQDSWLKRILSRAFIGLLNYLSGANYDYRTANFGIYRRAVVDAIRSMGDQSRFFPVMVRWTGFRTT